MKRLLCLILTPLCLCGLLCACAQEKHEKTFFAMDTYVTFTVYGQQAALLAAENTLYDLSARLARTGEASEVQKLNEAKGAAVTVSEDILSLFNTATWVYRESGGAFDITVEPIVAAYGFYDKDYRVPSEEEIDTLLPKVNGELAACNRSVAWLYEHQSADLGGIAKGYIADQCAATIRKYDVSGAILSLGGNVRALGTKPDGTPFTVAVTDPQNTAAYLGTVALRDASLVTAGGYQRYFERDGKTYHHIIDPHTGHCADSGILSATVLSEDGAMADALSTALFVLGEQQAVQLWKRLGGFEMLLVTEGGGIVLTPGMQALFSPAEGSAYRIETIT